MEAQEPRESREMKLGSISEHKMPEKVPSEVAFAAGTQRGQDQKASTQLNSFGLGQSVCGIIEI